MSSATSADISRQLRLLLLSSSDASSLDGLLDLVDAFVVESSAAADPQVPVAYLEDELQAIYKDAIDHAVPAHANIALAVLYHLLPVLSPTSLISTWFDLALRPALREPKLSPLAVERAKQLIIAACDDTPRDGYAESNLGRDKRKEKVGDFRRRLMDLYLLDVLNESSGDDIVEWAQLNEEQRDKKARWKVNLEDVLVKFGIERPHELFTEVYHCFTDPSSRLQLLLLLTAYTSHHDFSQHAPVLASHPLMSSLINSLLLDNSSTVFSIALTLMTKLLPIFAVYACNDLKRLLPDFLAILARVICWRVREAPLQLPTVEHDPETSPDVKFVLEDEARSVKTGMHSLPVREDLGWVRLEMTFDGATSAAPSPHQYFTFLYYLFPCNAIRFLRLPVKYLQDGGLESPYAVEWDDALDEDQIKSKSEPLLKSHVMHPVLIWRDADEELARPDFWAQYDVAKIVGDCTMVDVRNAALGMKQERSPQTDSIVPSAPPPVLSEPQVQSPQQEVKQSPTAVTFPPTPGRWRVSLQDMLATSVALKSGLDIEVVQPSSDWPSSLFPTAPSTRSQSRDDASALEAGGEGDAVSLRPSLERLHGDFGHEVPSQVAQAIASLQREVLLLRNELNFELWMTRENVKHIGRLYQDRVISRTAEIERQGLHNKLREYKNEANRMQRDLNEHKEQASKMKNEYAAYNRELQDKLGEFRNEKKAWVAEAAAMRAADKEAKDTFAAQGQLLAEAVQKVFQLETKIKENRHKVDRLHDYENQIDHLVDLQRLWEVDLERLNNQEEYLQAFTSKYRKMELRLQAYGRMQAEIEETALRQRQQVREMEIELKRAQKQVEVGRKLEAILHAQSSSSDDYAKMTQANKRLRQENSELREMVEEMQAMNDILKAQVSESRGLAVPGPKSPPSTLAGGQIF